MNKVLTLFAAILLLFSISSCGRSKPGTATEQNIIVLAPSAFKEKSDKQLILDVRSPIEFAEGHLEGAVNRNIKSDDFSENVKDYDRNNPIFLYCRSGRRSNLAAEKLSEMGFKKIYDLEGGILNWIEEEYKVAK